MAASVRTRQELLVEFDERGFLILDEALSPDQILVLNQAIDYHFKKYPVEWVKHDESLMETMTALSSMSDFDFTIENPTTLGVLRSLIGEGITFEEFEIIIRDPTATTQSIV